jgi:selenide,water dikinase
MCRASRVSADISADHVPAVAYEVFELIACDCIPGGSRDNLETANKIVDWAHTPPQQQVLLTDAQTSGGLLLAVSPRQIKKVLTLLERYRTPCAAIIGKIVPRRKRLICINQ